jgi:hypothetical protein
MKILLLLFFLLLSFNTSAAYVIEAGTNSCDINNTGSHLVGSMFLYEQDSHAAIASVNWASTTCYGSSFKSVNGTYNYRSVKFNSGRSINYKIRRVAPLLGCDFDTCKQIAEDECSAQGQTFDPTSYVFRGPTDYDGECNPPPPEQPIKNAEECQTLSNNQCDNRGSAIDSIFTDNGDFTYSCNYTCGDGTTGNENGSLANNNDGFCDINDPNDLADCDVVDNTDPDCVIGCGDAFTPSPTNDLPYNSDGTTTSDGTGTDGMTTIQGDVLINEIIKSSNINAEETIKSANQITEAVVSIDSNDKLSELILAVKDNKPQPSGGGSLDDTNIVSAINSSRLSGDSLSVETIEAINNNSLNNITTFSSTYDTSNFDSLFSDPNELDARIADKKQTLINSIDVYKSNLTSQLSFLTPTSQGYSSNDLVITQGSFDISWSRFSQYFSSIGIIVYSLAGLISLSILFVGRSL